MYAVIQTGGKQYKVEEGLNLKIEKIEGDAGAEVLFEEVLMLGGESGIKIGTPTLEGAKVSAKVLRQARDRKITVYKKKRRKGYEKKYGHRQPFTMVQITKINA